MSEKIFPETINENINVFERLERINHCVDGYLENTQTMRSTFGVDDVIELIGIKVVFFVNERDFYFFNEENNQIEINGKEAFIGSVLGVEIFNNDDEVKFRYKSKDGNPLKSIPFDLKNQTSCLFVIKTTFGEISGPFSDEGWMLEANDGKKYENGEVFFKK